LFVSSRTIMLPRKTSVAIDMGTHLRAPVSTVDARF
jgi:hypothetical protein